MGCKGCDCDTGEGGGVGSGIGCDIGGASLTTGVVADTAGSLSKRVISSGADSGTSAVGAVACCSAFALSISKFASWHRTARGVQHWRTLTARD